MELLVEITHGHGLGRRFPLFCGAELGRKKGDILVDDPKVSTRHAYVEKDANSYVLKDAGSSNGIRVNNRKVLALLLKPGVVFQVGDTYLTVIEKPEPAWKKTLQSLLNDHALQSITKKIEPFSSLIRLNIVEGIQSETQWTLGYGPRLIGGECIEFNLYEKQAPSICFELKPQKDKIEFLTDHPDIVLLNERSISSSFLSDGDIIQIGLTKIKIELVKDYE